MKLKNCHTTIYFLSILLICSFKSNSIKNKDLIGIWVFSIYNANYQEYIKMDSLKNDETGFIFKKKGRLIKRESATWCGTPPIAYNNYKGTWKYTSDSTIHIKHKYWGGTTEMELLIISLNENTLKLKILSYKN